MNKSDLKHLANLESEELGKEIAAAIKKFQAENYMCKAINNMNECEVIKLDLQHVFEIELLQIAWDRAWAELFDQEYEEE